LSKLLAALSRNSELKIIVLSSTSVNDSDLQSIAKIPNVKEIYLRDDPAITGKGLAAHDSLKIDVLALPGCHVTPTDVDYLKKLQVKNITVPKRYWSPSQIGALAKALHCTVKAN
jgi:hypothetical protein